MQNHCAFWIPLCKNTFSSLQWMGDYSKAAIIYCTYSSELTKKCLSPPMTAIKTSSASFLCWWELWVSRKNRSTASCSANTWQILPTCLSSLQTFVTGVGVSALTLKWGSCWKYIHTARRQVVNVTSSVSCRCVWSIFSRNVHLLLKLWTKS